MQAVCQSAILALQALCVLHAKVDASSQVHAWITVLPYNYTKKYQVNLYVIVFNVSTLAIHAQIKLHV